jgi:hypothetical protein
MSPEQITGWIQIGTLAINLLGLGIADVQKLIAAVHTSPDPAAVKAIVDGLLADALVRENIARAMAGLPPATS